MKTKLRIAALCACFVLLLSGCFSFDSDDFYTLPKLPRQYQKIQEAVDSAVKRGSYSAPILGTNRQAIQQVDLDGDGQEEVLVFCKQEGERPLRVLILRRVKGNYKVIATLEGEGTAFESVQYAQIDGEPGMEILLCRRLGEQVQQILSVYTVDKNTASELMSVSYSAFTTVDLDGDGRTDVFLVRANSDGPRANAELYRFRDGDLRKDPEASLSTAAESVKRIITGNVAEGTPAVFVASAYDENHLITDVFALEGGSLSNISLNDESGQSTETVRNYFVYSTDIDNDGIVEMPNTLPLAVVEDDESSRDQYRIVWYNLSPTGERTEKMTTYHNFNEGWFFYLPESWGSDLCVIKEKLEGASGTCFMTVSEAGRKSQLLTIYAFTGEKAASLCSQDGRIPLTQRGEVYYAMKIGIMLRMEPEEIIRRFSFIAPDLLPN